MPRASLSLSKKGDCAMHPSARPANLITGKKNKEKKKVMLSTKGTTNHGHNKSVSKAICPPPISISVLKNKEKNPRSDANKSIRSF